MTIANRKQKQQQQLPIWNEQEFPFQDQEEEEESPQAIERLSQLVSELRKEFRSMEEIGRQLGMTGTNAQKWEDKVIDSIGNLKVKNLRKLAAIKNWTIDELLHYLEGTAPPEKPAPVLDINSLSLQEKLSLNLELAKLLIQESANLEKLNLSGSERRKLAWLLDLSMRADKRLIAVIVNATGLKRSKIEGIVNAVDDLEISLSDLDALAPCCYAPAGWDGPRPTDLSGRRLANGRELLAAIKNGNGAIK